MTQKKWEMIKIIGIGIGLALCLAFAFSPLRINAKNVKNPKKTTTETCIGHRGAMDLAPPNTLASFQEAVKAGYRRIECDLWYTRSKDILACHHESILKYTGVNKKIWELSLKNRKNYPIKYGKRIKRYPGLYFLSIDEVLVFASRHHVKLYLHLKKGGTTFTKKALRKLNRAIKRHHLSREPVVFSSNKAIVRKMQKYKWTKGYLCTKAKKKRIRAAADFASDHGCTYLLCPYRKKRKPTRPIVRYGHDLGLKMAYYRIWNKKRARRVFRKGGDFCITDKILFVK